MPSGGGRGRRGRAWVSPKGNLFASVLLIDPGPRDRLGELPMVAAVALAEAV
ncbi:MAG: bifunctional biotin--[acetyl-CoA-carboxylase] synthetase/biotin operon repressor, partial [Thermomonas sp.]